MTGTDGLRRRMDLLPVVRRARGYRLYGESGKRYLDMYLDGGRAILGHKPAAVLKNFKNNLDRGLLAPYPSVYRRRLGRALIRLLPDYPVCYLFPDLTSALREIGRAFGGAMPGAVTDPALENPSPGGVSLWRPFLPDMCRVSYLLPVLPLPGSFVPCVVLAGGESPVLADDGFGASPVVLAALERSVWDLINRPRDYGETEWEGFPASGFFRKGPYLAAGCGETEYDDLFAGMLEKGILLSPRYPGPSIIPGEYSPGEVNSFPRY